MNRRTFEPPETHWRSQLHAIVFEAETPSGRAFDIGLLWAIVASVVAVMLESVPSVKARVGPELVIAEWAFTLLFTLEYGLRLVCVRRPLGYVFSFYGAVDLLAVLPTYLSLFLPGSQSLLVIRALRLLRLFRVLKLARFVQESNQLLFALRASRFKITIFLGWVLGLVTILGAAMYVVEGPEHGFTSVPAGVYWAIITLTTVGYGDITPGTSLGKFLASFVMILGYSILAVPTGIVSTEIAKASQRRVTTVACSSCSREGHDEDATHCKYCGTSLHPEPVGEPGP